MTTDEFIVKVSGIENYLQGDFNKDILLRGCLDLTARIAGRVQETNILGSGTSKDYSSKPMLVGRKSFLPNKEGVFKDLLSDAKSKKDSKSDIHWVTINKNGSSYRLIVLPGGYAELRRREGNLNTKKNYFRSGEMWKGFGIKQIEDKKITIGGKTEVSQDRINWNSSRDEENIIAPNQQEVDELTNFLSVQVKKYINAALGS